MFPSDEKTMNDFGLEKTARILPHDNDTGGFYIARFRKIKSVITPEILDKQEEVVEKK